MAKRRDPIESPLAAFMHTARQQWLTADEAEGDNRKQGLIDLEFLNLQQWPQGIKDEREKVGQERPCLVIDQIGEPFRQLTNKVREARSAVKIVPEDGDADPKVAEKLQEIVRGIEYASDASIAYVTAFEGAAGPGWGYARLLAEYDDPTHSRDQVIRIADIGNQFSVWMDPYGGPWDYTKKRFAFVVEAMPTDAYNAKYPESLVAKSGGKELFQGIGNDWKDWFPEGRVIVAEYYYRDDESIPMVELEDGTVLKKADVPKGTPVKTEWNAEKPCVKWCKINGLEVLEGNDELTAGRRIPGTTIPIRACYGQILNVNGQWVYRGMVRAARDPQQMYNYNNSALVEDMALVPKTKVFMAEGQEEGHEQEWAQSISSPTAYVRYKPTALGDKLVPPPSVAQFVDPAKMQSLVIAIQQNKADLRSTLSYYDQTDPARANTDQSGKAQLVRKQENDEGKTGYLEMYSRFLTSMGKLLIEWIPEVYDRKGRIVRGMDMEDNPSFLMLNQPYTVQDGFPQAVPQEAQQLGNGNYEHIDLSKGKYGVRVTVGKSYLTQKQEAGENGLRLMEVLPNQAPGFADLVVRNLDGPGNDQIADRLERMVPPNLKADEGEQEQNPEMLKAQLQQAQTQMQEMDQVIKGLQEAVKTDQVKVEGDLKKTEMSTSADAQKAQASDATKVQIAQMDAQVKIQLEEMKFAHERELLTLKMQGELEKARFEVQKLQLTAQADAQGQRADHAAEAQGRREEFQHEDTSRREGFAHEDDAAEMGHQHALEQQAAKPEPRPTA